MITALTRSHSSMRNLEALQNLYLNVNLVKSSDPWSGNPPFPLLSLSEGRRIVTY